MSLRLLTISPSWPPQLIPEPIRPDWAGSLRERLGVVADSHGPLLGHAAAPPPVRCAVVCRDHRLSRGHAGPRVAWIGFNWVSGICTKASWAPRHLGVHQGFLRSIPMTCHPSDQGSLMSLRLLTGRISHSPCLCALSSTVLWLGLRGCLKSPFLTVAGIDPRPPCLCASTVR